MAFHHLRRVEEELLGQAQHRLDLRIDAGLGRHARGRFHQLRHFVDIGAHEAQQGAGRIGAGQTYRPVQAIDAAGEFGGQSPVLGFVLQG
ncbi:hypothetical protein D3C71_1756590 [compost metagenome]